MGSSTTGTESIAAYGSSSGSGSSGGSGNALLFTMAMQPEWPSYASLVTSAGLTTWPETWGVTSVAGAVSRMHGTLNGLGLWFTQGVLGVQVAGGCR